MVKEEKLKQVEELAKLLVTYKVVGILDLFKLPTKQLQDIKKTVSGSAMIKVVKKAVMVRALQNTKNEKLLELEKLIPLQPGLVLTNDNAFKFYLTIDKLKSDTFAKEGDIINDDILITAGPTNLMPGPVITELSKVGLIAGVEEGKVAIKKDKVVAKKGDVVSKDLASVLRKLKIQPVKIGLSVLALHDNGMVYKKEVLSLVGDNYINAVRLAFSQALNLSVAISYPTKETVGYILAKAYQQAKAIQNKMGV